MNEATPKQIKWLYAVTHIQAARWMEKKITVKQAAEVLRLGFLVLDRKEPDPSQRPAFEKEVRKYFPEFICPEKMAWMYGKKKKKKAKKDPAQAQMLPQDEPAEPQPAPAPDPGPIPPAEYQIGQKVRITKNPLFGYTGKIGTITDMIDIEMDGVFTYTVETPNLKAPDFMRHYSLLVDDIEPAYNFKPIPDLPKAQEPQNKNGYIKPSIYESATRTIKAGINLLIHGPAGCGKSRMVKEISDDLNRTFVTVSFSGGTRYAQVFGSTKLEDGNSRFEAGPLLKAVQLENAVILLDEIFSGDPDVVMGLNSLLEPDSREIQTPAGIIKVHESCTFVAAANTTGRAISRQYTGAQRSDDSLIDRFTHLSMDYDPKAEKSILKAMDLNGNASQLQDKVGSLRKKIKENNIPFDPSTRRLINAARLVRDADFSADEAFNMAFLNSLSEAEKRKVS